MPATVSHALSMTTPDNPAYENKPSNWNATHALTINATGSEISGAFSNANGVSFGLSAGAITASIQTSYAASNHSHGNPTLNLTNLSGTTASNSAGFTLSLSAGAGGAGDGVNILAAGTQTAATTGTVLFSNSNGITFGMSNSSVITAQHNAITTGMLSNAATISNINVSGGTASSNLSAFKLIDSQGVSWSLDTGSKIYATVKTDYQSSNANYLTSQSNQQITAANGGFTFQTLSFSNLNGISFGTSAGSAITASHNAITTGRASNDAVGLNTAQTNVTWTVNSSGLSFNAAGYAGTGTSATNASITLNSNGLQISVAAPGAAAENNWVNLLGANTSGNTTASGSTVGFSGINMTLSGTNASVINFSVPATSSLVGANGISISTNGSTISVQEIPMSQRMVFPPGGLTVVSAMGNGSFSINRIDVYDQMTATRLDVPFLVSIASSATANTWGLAVTVFGAVYTRNVSTLSSLSSGSTAWNTTLASNTAGNTGLIAHAIRPLSIPINMNMSAGEYYIGFGISTNTSSVGTATTALGNTWSVMGGQVYSSAVGFVGDFTAATNTSTGLLGGHGVYSAAISTVPPTVSLSAINQTGSYYARANIGLIFRNI